VEGSVVGCADGRSLVKRADDLAACSIDSWAALKAAWSVDPRAAWSVVWLVYWWVAEVDAMLAGVVGATLVALRAGTLVLLLADCWVCLRAASTVGRWVDLMDVEMVETWATQLAFWTVCTLVDEGCRVDCCVGRPDGLEVGCLDG